MKLNAIAKFWLALFGFGLTALFIGGFGAAKASPVIWGLVAFIPLITGGLGYGIYSQKQLAPGIHNNGIFKASLTHRGFWAYLTGIALTGFYCIYYWAPHWLEGLYRMLDPVSFLLRGEPTQSWFAYGTLYTLAVVIMGVRGLVKYRHSNYQKLRISVVLFCQVILSWLIPGLLVLFKQPEKYLNYSWPLSYKDFWPTQFLSLWQESAPKLAAVLAIYGLAFTFILTPVLTYFYGKRWYCSWVCGCGGLANTLGDPWRQLSSKSKRAWDIEKISIYSVLGFVILTTATLWLSWANSWWNPFSNGLAQVYGFLIGMIFSGVIGTGFYPLLGTRVWCRFGCPQAAILGILQRVFSRFRITTNGSQCISCGNCSTYCEMGIDVRSYAQLGQNIIRASCVGCGICSAVCPRGVLNLENGPKEGRYNESIALSDLSKSGVELNKPKVAELWP